MLLYVMVLQECSVEIIRGNSTCAILYVERTVNEFIYEQISSGGIKAKTYGIKKIKWIIRSMEELHYLD